MVVAEKFIIPGLRNTETSLFTDGGTWYLGLSEFYQISIFVVL